MKPLLAKPLLGNYFNLMPLEENHRESLREITQDKELWKYFPYTLVGEHFDPGFDKALKALKNGDEIGFVVCRKTDGKIVGSTRYYEMKPKFSRLTIGHTFYVPELRGTLVNPECKYLLLQNAFENWQINRVEINADTRNLHSRAAIKKLGATEEGILRQHILMENGYRRDTAIYSILKEEWPKIKSRLIERISLAS
jgi:RimJ/RimL family protein N-acetyltransferase